MTRPLLKAYYGDIFFEFLVHKSPRDSIVILSGFPSSNNYKNEMNFLFEKGYNVFYPRYKGNYQSRGFFLNQNIAKEIYNFINELKKGEAKSLWDMEIKRFKIKNVILFAGSFGGAVACGVSALDKNISKLVLFAPVWDFNDYENLKGSQDLDKLTIFVKRAYSNLYRIKFTSFSKAIFKSKECFPNIYLRKFRENKTKILIFHDPKDTSVPISHTLKMKKKYPFELIKHSKGHTWNVALINKNWKKISKFLKN
ncbi:MAG: alpha/beta hydrolase family protein [Minisyncoccales bacterium]